jgi:Fe-S cluster assembly protein SufD
MSEDVLERRRAALLERFTARRAALFDPLAAREEAARAFAASGLPTRKVEAFHFTDLRPLAAHDFDLPDRSAAPASPPALPTPLAALAARVVFVDGRFVPEFSAPPAAFFTPLAEAPAFLPRTASPLAAINTMFAEDGMVLTLPEGTAGGTLLLMHEARTEGAAYHLRHRIVLGAGARLVLIERAQGRGRHWHNPVYDVTLGAGARLLLLRAVAEGEAAFHTASLYAELGAGAALECALLLAGTGFARNELDLRLQGEGAEARLAAAQLLRGHDFGDLTAVITHAAPRTTSNQRVKNVIDGEARAVFQGRIAVTPAGQKTDGYQKSDSLLLSPRAESDTKPELEIFADDVKCSHGATVGAIDEEALFYLRSRGIPLEEARALLVGAFIEGAWEGVSEELRPLLDALTAEWREGVR